MKVLISSVSKKIPLVKAVKEAVLKIDPKGVVVGADLDDKAIGRYFCDQFIKLNRLDSYSSESFITILKEHGITHIIPTRDGELLFYAKLKQVLKKENIFVMSSSEKAIESSLDKYKFYQYSLQHHLPVIPTSLDIEEIESDHLVVKERFGAGSTSLGINISRKEALLHSQNLSHPVFQPYIEGNEFSIDLYIDKDRKVRGVLPRSRDVVVHGESQVSQTVNDSMMVDLAISFAKSFNLYGPIILQVMKDHEGKLHLIECNARFGGASTLSIKAGLDSFYWFFLESMHQALPSGELNLGKNKLKLIRYAGDKFIENTCF